MMLLRLFWIFFKIGLFTIGGGMAMLPLMQNELVTQGYMSMQETVDMVAISQMTPGPFAVNAATFAGMRLCGVGGAAMATLGVMTPSLILTTLVARFFVTFRRQPLVQSAMDGLRPVVLALILSSLLSIAAESLFPGTGGLAGGLAALDIPVLALALAGVVALQCVKRLSPILLICLYGVIGMIFLR